MKASVDQDTCIACGLCPTICPEVFAFDDSDKASAIVDKIPEEVLSSAEEARDSCPVSAIDLD